MRANVANPNIGRPLKISTILRRAANERLWDGEASVAKKHIFSCSAVSVIDQPDRPCWETYVRNSPTMKFLRSLGLKPNSIREFNSFEHGSERQAARYAWLMHASRVAREMGV